MKAMSTKTAARTEVDPALRQEWLDTMTGLKNQIKAWADQEPDWTFTAQEEHKIEEAALGEYPITVWKLQTPDGEVRLEPIARNYPGRGIVELYAWPSLRRVHLLHGGSEDDWRVRVDSGFNLRQPWDREHFITLVRDLIGAEDLLTIG